MCVCVLASMLFAHCRQDRLAQTWLKVWQREWSWSAPLQALANLTYQPLDAVAEYFGENLTFYFAWYMFVASLVGCIFVSHDPMLIWF